MDKRPPNVEWIITQSDADWERLQEPPRPDSELSASPRRDRQRYCWRVAACLLLLAIGGSGGWRSDQTALPVPAASLTAQPALTVAAYGSNPADVSHPNNQWEQEWWHQFEQAGSGLHPGFAPTAPAAYADVTVQTVEFAGDRAVARVIINANRRGLAYRQTWFYRHTAAGWMRTERNAALWGPKRSLATPYFVYHFRQKDALVVIAVAPQLDALYTTLWQNFGLPIRPTPQKLAIDVSVTQPPGQIAAWFVGPDRILVSSPAVYWAPVELTDAELLAQSIVLPLLEHMLAQANEYHAVKADWQLMLKGLYLWQVWDLELPLAAWREDVVKWLYLDLPTSQPGQAVVLPEYYPELCAAHTLWMPSPAQINLPLLCARREGEAQRFLLWRLRDPLTRLDQFAVPVGPGEDLMQVNRGDRFNQPGQAIALATLIEYAAATYGRERLPVLVAGLGHYDSWETLLPAVFGVAAAEFEAGWQAYLTAHYGVP